MKHLAFVVALVAIAGLMAFTNPTMDDYSQFVRNGILKEMQRQDSTVQLFGSALSGVASGLVASQTVRRDYVFFSIYELRFGKEQFKAAGLFKNFIVLEKPDFKSKKSNS